MMSPKDMDIDFSKTQDEMAKAKGYIDEAREMLESAFSDEVPTRRRWLPAVVAAGVVATAASVLWVLFTPTSLSVTVEGRGSQLAVGSWVSADQEEGLLLAFSDGSKVDLERNSELRLQELRETGAHLLLERGSVAVSVVHRKKTDWRLDVGPYHILVTGTRFSADWIPEKKAFKVAVQEGTVIVDGPMLTDGKSLSHGDDIYVSLEDNVVEINKTDRYEKIVSKAGAATEATFPKSSETLTAANRAELASPVVRDKAPAGASTAYNESSWRVLAKRGDYAGAVAMAEKAGFKRVVGTSSLQDLMLLGDAARLAKKHARAAAVYKTVRHRFSRTSEAQRAAFALGRIAFQSFGKYREAARWFGLCYRENPKGTMAREAAGRLMEALNRAGDQAGARDAAKQYQARYRNGPHAKLAKQILSQGTSSK